MLTKMLESTDSDDNLDKIKDRYVGWDRDDENLCME